MNTKSFRHAAVAAAVVAASAGASVSAQAATPQGRIVFSRSQQSAADAFPRASSLWMLDLGTRQVRPLTTSTDRVFDAVATWAPNGSGIVFDRGASRPRAAETHSLHYLRADGTHLRSVVHGLGDFSKPAWGPGDRIAYIAAQGAGNCVSITDATGTSHRALFCVPSTTELARPLWSKDGRQLFVAGNAPEGKLEPVFHALAYRIDVATGRATLLSDIVMYEPLELTFSPDGTRGVYADVVANDMTLVDFRNGAATALPRGHAPSWSPDGKRIAYAGEVYETGAQFRYYEPLYVMNANGTNVRRLTDSRVDNHAYTPAQWSKDNIHVLVNRRVYSDVGLTHATYALRIVDANTKALVQLPAGFADQGGWFEP
ncbi:hypothetical protein LVB87_11110 [Lysobacter sp. KIS68-7]|uniref:TolB family protein n=1 Tax=Lysobacter sp. KIS68-7 TaxID=2904252 RepID=UPI001E623551|nr:hypothetical protein [Lysobacter sp. KIS68-7]UHQ18734.1 hypothetical protein LVB87_11110 [Lysobacter sp. KIS68-7]